MDCAFSAVNLKIRVVVIILFRMYPNSFRCRGGFHTRPALGLRPGGTQDPPLPWRHYFLGGWGPSRRPGPDALKEVDSLVTRKAAPARDAHPSAGPIVAPGSSLASPRGSGAGGISRRQTERSVTVAPLYSRRLSSAVHLKPIVGEIEVRLTADCQTQTGVCPADAGL